MRMRRRKGCARHLCVTGIAIVGIGVLAVFVVFGRGSVISETPQPESTEDLVMAQQASTPIGVSEDEVVFDLSPIEVPDFENNVMSASGDSEEVVPEVSYFLPEGEAGDALVFPGVTEGSEEPDLDESATDPSVIEPTEDTKYPNTGKFLEDD